MIGVLAYYHHSDGIKRAGVKSIKNQTCRRETPTGLVLGTDIRSKEFEIRLVKLRL